jgi:hypothetical protein
MAMNPNITVEFDPYHTMNKVAMKDMVCFSYLDHDAAIEWRSICDIDAWLQAHDIEYTVKLHYKASAYIHIECPEARAMIKLAFEEWISPNGDGAETMSMSNPCVEITI